jgi:hypothetical protein
VTVDEAVEESPQSRQVQFLGRRRQFKPLEILADVAGGDTRAGAPNFP